MSAKNWIVRNPQGGYVHNGKTLATPHAEKAMRYTEEGARAVAETLGEGYVCQCVFDQRAYVQGLPLMEALWWFIENVDLEDDSRTDLYFDLRERMRVGK